MGVCGVKKFESLCPILTLLTMYNLTHLLVFSAPHLYPAYTQCHTRIPIFYHTLSGDKTERKSPKTNRKQPISFRLFSVFSNAETAAGF